MMKFIWKKSLFSNNIRIYAENELVGNLENKMFIKAKGRMNNIKYLFDKIPYFTKIRDIVDVETGEIIGRVDGNGMKKGILITNLKTNKDYYYTSSSFLIKDWNIISSDDKLLLSTGFITEGVILSEFDDEMAMLVGVYLSSLYWQFNFAAFVLIGLTIIDIIMS